MTNLNISTGHPTMSGKKGVISDKRRFTTDAVVWREVKFCLISYRPLKTQKHSVNIDFFYYGFSFCKRFNRQFTYTVFISKTVRCVWIRRFYTNTLLVCFALFGTASPLKTFYMSLHSHKNFHSTKTSWWIKCETLFKKNFILGWRFNFEKHTKNVREKETLFCKNYCADVLSDTDRHVLT